MWNFVLNGNARLHFGDNAPDMRCGNPRGLHKSSLAHMLADSLRLMRYRR